MNRTDLAHPFQHFLICQKRCNECLYSKRRIVSEGRADEIQENLASEGFFICHKATVQDHNFKACCRAFWDANKDTNKTLLAVRALFQLFSKTGEEDHVWWVNVETGELTPYTEE